MLTNDLARPVQELFATRRTAPLILDVRRTEAFEAADRIIACAQRGAPEQLEQWATTLSPVQAVVVYCVHGGQVSQTVAQTLRAKGIAAHYLKGGITAWQEAGRPTVRKHEYIRTSGTKPTLWVTRERPKIDRVACPWLIRRFIDRQAEFLYVPTAEVLTVAATTGAIPFDIPGVHFSHEGDLCSFDSFIRHFDLVDPPLQQLARIVRGADTSRHDLTPQSPGLFALALGLAAVFEDDQEVLQHGLVLYDALYAWCGECQAETHNWPPS
ncbi:chromate resistance protein ChrB domain-containing protein [Candidatus Cyanaurora vandensis]|uniref:chromate resistance protein ChrB domain-containing protein n=1 Tax=Candidatus Cyanaurora vandensis TaxID=2714958 RepID=UPI00257EF4E3|nr:chromate resistance protein ChrB domain-containing protein [Candidatus Cyanaurora vandensis]